MYRTKKDVDKHVENLTSKLSVKEFQSRAYSIARLYYDVGDYACCQRYVEQYLSQKDNNAAAYKLLGQALEKLGQKERALEQYKTSLDIDPTQSSLILDVCELLADKDITVEPGCAKYWCEKAETVFPKHPITFQLREKLMSIMNPDPEALVQLLISELAVRPKDVTLHARLLKHYMLSNRYKEAFEHSFENEFGENYFNNNYSWYETVEKIIKYYSDDDKNDWRYQLLLLTVKERLCALSLAETPPGTCKGLVESGNLLYEYDQALTSVAKSESLPGHVDFYTSLLHHHRGQFVLHLATFLLRKAKRDLLSWREATNMSAPLMLVAWHTIPLDTKVNWLTRAPFKQQKAVYRWYLEGVYRCSQSGHYLISNIQDKSHTFIDHMTQNCSDTNWRDKLYDNIFTNLNHPSKKTNSDFISNAFNNIVLRLPRKTEVQAYDVDAQRLYPNSLHHFVWILLNYKNYVHFKCSIFDMLTPKSQNYLNCAAETLNKYDMFSFLYCSALTTQQNKQSFIYGSADKPKLLPASITDLLCTLPQMKWWDCAHKLSQNELGTELTDIRSTLSRGIEVVRCVDNHGLDPKLLCELGRIFSEKAKSATILEEKNHLNMRAKLYYSNAIPLLERLKNKMSVKLPLKRMFDYNHQDFTPKQISISLEECKLFVGVSHFNESEYEKAIELLTNLKSAQSKYYLSLVYKKMALDECNKDSIYEHKSKLVSLLDKAKLYANKTLETLKEDQDDSQHELYSDTQELLENIETHISRINSDVSNASINDIDGKYSSDENTSLAGSDQMQITLRNSASRVFRNLSSTPKLANVNTTNYRSAVDSQIFENPKIDLKVLERIDSTVNTFMEQTKLWVDENRNLGNQIMSSVNSNIQNTVDQFKLLKISIDQIKEQIGQCRDECKDVGELKKQLAELKKEIYKLKKPYPELAMNDENNLYNFVDNYKSNDPTSTFAAQLPFTPQVIPPFNPRIIPPYPMPPTPYSLYGQNLYNFYAQYSQLAQPGPVPGTSQICDPSRAPTNYPGVYRTPDEIYADMAHLIPPVAPPVSVSAPVAPVAVPSTKITAPPQAKEKSRSLPVNVVITSSDPLPTCTTTPAPILSVTIPPEHIKGTPHNYQIPMPSSNDAQINPPVFNATPAKVITSTSTTQNMFPIWNQSTVFKTTQSSSATPIVSSTAENKNISLFDTPKTGGVFNSSISESNKNRSGTSLDTTHNKSRTLSEKSNTSLDNYDPCPDFKPIIPLPAEVKVTTGEEDEIVIFGARAKLFRFADKQWKERGIGEIKLLQHNLTGKVRVLMRRDQVHKICANHIITSDMEIQPMQNETKAYFWVANDFADETVVFEKFCIRFKTADIAHQFYQAFMDARNNATSSVDNTIKLEKDTDTSVAKNEDTPKTSGNQSNKMIVGGFTFSSTPTFKVVKQNSQIEDKLKEPKVTIANPFSNLSFKTSSPLVNIFSTANDQPKIVTSSSAQSPSMESKANTSDTVEEFEPTVEFKPVVPLPALVDHKTGEENEIVIFEHRAKLLRFNTETKEWKERGLGNIKLLVHKENQKVRLLMRREQVMKVCCNHALTPDMVFRKMPNVDKAVTWCAKDFSEGELLPETLCLRFKTVQICDDFINAVKSAQSNMCDSKAEKEQNATKQCSQTGFGDKFKAKSGSWYCQSCYTNNLESFLNCACCETPRPSDGKAKSISKVTSSWGDQFKSKSGSWECKTCLIRNESNTENCCACNSPKDSALAKKETKSIFSGGVATKFTFGFPTHKDNTLGDTQNDPPVSAGWGDKFKPKPGTWDCKQCFVRNEANLVKCSACGSSKDPNTEKKEQSSLFSGLSSGPQFVFGSFIKSSESSQDKPKTESTSIFDGTGTHKFTFGNQNNFKFDVDSKIVENKVPTFGTVPAVKSTETLPLNFSTKKLEDTSTNAKPALLPTPKTESSFVTVPYKPKENSSFDFVFKSTSKTKSPILSPKKEEENENEYAFEDKDDIHFNPVVPLPDKVEEVTGEENDDELFAQRAKLFRFVAGEWKERGTGIVKILKHKETGKLRVVMRREQVFKLCLNHALTIEIVYTPKDQKTWLFAAYDFSEGELTLQQFCLRFQTTEIALDFKNTVTSALLTLTDPVSKDSSEEVIFVNEIQATSEEKLKAKELMLPDNFFTYKNKEQCPGCRGCRDDDNTQSVVEICNTPVKMDTPPADSSISSEYGTPISFNKTVDSSIFRTPFEVVKQNNQKNSGNNNKTITTSTLTTNNKENTLTPKNIIQENASGNSSLNNSVFGDNITITPSNTKNSILSTPKLNTASIIGQDEKSVKPKSIFGVNENTKDFASVIQAKPSFSSNSTATNKSIFNVTMESGLENKSIFTTSTNKPSDNNDTKDEKESSSKFISSQSELVNVFASAGQENILAPKVTAISKTGSLFGDLSGSIFRANQLDNTKPFNSENSIFTSGNKNWAFGSKIETGENGNVQSTTQSEVSINPTNELKSENGQDSIEKKETPFNIDQSLSFADLSTTGPGFGQKSTDFKWEGAGQQIFGLSGKSNAKNNSRGGEGDGVGDTSTEKENEEYDPHYEPIVPLPDEIIVTTGEEDEEKVFCQRCKLYRYTEATKEWKERGVGEIKILYHPTRKSYRLLLRRELVHKPVLNMLLTMDFELLPMKNSDRAWTWAGRNHAENPSGDQETLAVRFKTPTLAETFKEKVTECIRKLQADAAQAIREDKTTKEDNTGCLRLPKHLPNSARDDSNLVERVTRSAEPSGVQEPHTPVAQTSYDINTTQPPIEAEVLKDKESVLLRLPKHLSDSARVDSNIAMQVNLTAETSQASKSHGLLALPKSESSAENGSSTEVVQQGILKPQVHFEVTEREEDDDDEEAGEKDEDYEYNYYANPQVSSEYFIYKAGVQMQQSGGEMVVIERAEIQLFYCHEMYTWKIIIMDAITGKFHSEMLVSSDTDFKLKDTWVSWIGLVYIGGEPAGAAVLAIFDDADIAHEFYTRTEAFV